MCSHVDKEEDADFGEEHDEEWFQKKGVDRDKFNEDMYVVLMEKTEGQALTRVRAAAKGDGIQAYICL